MSAPQKILKTKMGKIVRQRCPKIGSKSPAHTILLLLLLCFRGQKPADLPGRHPPDKLSRAFVLHAPGPK